MTKRTSELEMLRAANPVLEEHDSTWSDSDPARRLFEEIEARAASTSPPTITRGRSGWRRPTITIPVFFALTASALLFASAIAGDRVITVDAAQALEDPAAVEAELAQQGIDADIRIVPANETLAGKWFHLYFPPDSSIDEETFWLMKSYVGVIDGRFDSVMERCPIGDCARTSILEIPGRVKGPMTLIVGREPQPGEEYWAHKIDWDNELAPSGALYCHRLEEKTPEEAGTILQKLGYQVIWVHEEDKFSEEVASPPPGSKITFAFFRGPGVIDVRTAAPSDAQRYMQAGGTPTEEHTRSSAPWAPDC